MKMLFASDSFKGSLTAVEICDLLQEAAADIFPDAETVSLPIADGGEGTVDALLCAMGGKRMTTRVTGPLLMPVDAQWGLLGDGQTAVLEMAQASGLPYVPAALGGVLKATLKSGIDAVLETVRFDEQLKQADLVVTGEGRIDGQSVQFGKVPIGVARRCAKANVPVLCICGGIGAGAEGLFAVCESTIQTTVSKPMALSEAIENARTLYLDAAKRLFRAVRIGQKLHV